MASGVRKQQEYERAKRAYIRENYEEAAEIIEKLVQESPNDPEILLLRGHIYCYFQDFDGAREQYYAVIENTDNQDYIENANSGLKTVQRWQEAGMENLSSSSRENTGPGGSISSMKEAGFDESEEGEVTGLWSEENWQIEADEDEVTDVSQSNLNNPFSDLSQDEITAISALEEEDKAQITDLDQMGKDSSPLTDRQSLDDASPTAVYGNTNADLAASSPDSESMSYFEEEGLSSGGGNGAADNHHDSGNTKTFLYSSETPSQSGQNTGLNLFAEEEFDLNEYANEGFLTEGRVDQDNEGPNTFGQNQTERTQNSPTADTSNSYSSQNIEEGESTKIVFERSSMNQQQGDVESSLQAMREENPEFIVDDLPTGEFQAPQDAEAQETAELTGGGTTAGKRDLFVSSKETVSDASFETSSQEAEPVIEHEQGLFAFVENASLGEKRNLVSGAVGCATAVVVAIGSFAVSSWGEENQSNAGNFGKAAAVGLMGGVGSGLISWGVGSLLVKQIKRSTGDLQAQLYAVQQGNLEAKATVYSQDEFGQLATGFNQMTRVVSTTTNEAQRKEREQEKAKEDLQRQVIRLLDDVEGAARGDLTVQAQVSADVLGAVADAFNLTIRNLRTIVHQVKEAARQVNEGAAESAEFAHGLSEDALQQAEELAVSLNSAQMMTESIQRVADNAKEAESVARSASETALKGGEAVDSTVAGILQIRETVAQSTRKVKRLAESSQEISKIVSVISQIATRTNNLALNASIEAARAGEAGQRFTIIADEVRQLADRSTKSLREIEKIVLQIQSETSSVMIAMEEGTQQVIEGTERAEQAKNALEDIIQVSNHIDSLVQSITADTVEQSETAQAVAQVMQSVEMTAQGTSQESQQVSTALQNLVSLAGDLLASVERFRISPEDEHKG